MLRKFSRGLNFNRVRKHYYLNEDEKEEKHLLRFAVEIIAAAAIAFVLVFSVGYRVTVTGSSMTGTLREGDRILVNRISTHLSGPKSGDVIVYRQEGGWSHDTVKRVVAVPGDTVQIQNGYLYVNGSRYDEKQSKTIENAGIADKKIKVEAGHYFVLGDNPDSSEDSRFSNVGNISKDAIIGKAWFVAGPFRDFGRIKSAD